jgi:hypothetical protein
MPRRATICSNLGPAKQTCFSNDEACRIEQERQCSPSYGGRSIFGWESPQPLAKTGRVGGP